MFFSKDATKTSQLSSTHEKADTPLRFHDNTLFYNDTVVSSNYTDVPLNLASHFLKTNCKDGCIIAGSKNSPKYIPSCTC